jgi:hypothetical protein
VRSCAVCAAELDVTKQLLAAAPRLPGPPLSSSARERIAAQLLDMAAAAGSAGGRLRRRRTRLMVVAAAVLLLCVAGGAARHIVRSRSRSPAVLAVASRARLMPVGAVTFERTRPPPDEVVALDDGTLDVDVSPLGLAERFRVVTADSEVEVRGTSFRMTAHRGELTAVYVRHGRVDVRRRGESPLVLGGDEQWTRPSKVAMSGLSAGAVPAKPVVSRQRPRRENTSPTDSPRISASTEFDEAWRLLRAGQADQAALKLAEIEERPDAAELVEDAMFWRAVALGRLGRASDARAVLQAFMTRFPASGHRGEAAVMLGWNLLRAGERDRAVRLFESAATDRVDAVRASARAGLDRARSD